jgi:hypothetical protein
VRPEKREQVLVEVQQCSELCGRFPASLAVMQDDGEDGRKPLGLWVIAPVRLPNADQVAQHTEGHERLAAALVLEQDVEQGGPIV